MKTKINEDGVGSALWNCSTESNINKPTEIEILGSTDYITEWTQGTRYHYDIHIRIGGGIRITVRATDWEIIYAETPGLTI